MCMIIRSATVDHVLKEDVHGSHVAFISCAGGHGEGITDGKQGRAIHKGVKRDTWCQVTATHLSCCAVFESKFHCGT